MNCENCQHWKVRHRKVYADGYEKIIFDSRPGHGHCEELGIETPFTFGCNKHVDGADHVITETMPEPVFKYFVMIDCPDCAGATSGSPGARGHRCAGTGKVRLYDDGYIGDEQTRLHPKEKPEQPKCHSCQAPMQRDWKACPACGARALAVAETETPPGGGLS